MGSAFRSLGTIFNCWLIDKTYRYLKIDLDKNELEEEDKDYVNNDIDVREKKVREFVIRNFVGHPQLFPDSDYFTIGSYIRNPNMFRPRRIRLGGRYIIKF